MSDLIAVIKGILAGLAIVAMLGLLIPPLLLGLFHYVEWLRVTLGW